MPLFFNLDVSHRTNITVVSTDEHAPQEGSHSISSVLTVANPPLTWAGGPSARLCATKNWAALDPGAVRPWDDFDLQTLTDAFGHVLELPALLVHNPVRFSIQNATSLLNVQTSYLKPLLQSPLDVGSRALAAQLGIGAGNVTVEHGHAVGMFRSSLALIWESQPRALLVLGVTRTSNVWSSGSIASEHGPGRLFPLQHAATLARDGQTRYTFVFTEVEVVVARVFVSDCNLGRYGVEWKAIPWGASGEGKLTVGLAIWFLAMMALNESHRGVVQGCVMAPLNGWFADWDAEGSLAYTHHLSRRRLAELPASGRLI